MGSDERNTPTGPLIFRPEIQCHGVEPARQMLRSDLPLQDKFTSTEAVQWQPWTGTLPMTPQTSQITDADVKALQDYLQSVDTNILVPEPTPNPHPPESPPPEEEEEGFWSPGSGSIGGMKTEDGGVGSETVWDQDSPDNGTEVDTDFGGKWDPEITIASGDVEHEFFDVSVAEGTFGDPGDWITGEGSVLAADSKATAGFELTNESLTAGFDANLSGHMLQGSLETNQDGPLRAEVEATAVSGELTGEGKLVLSPEQATLEGKLALRANLAEVEGKGEIVITPQRIGNVAIGMWNRWSGDDVAEISDAWDIGLYVGAEPSASVGVGAEAEATAGYEDGRLGANLGAKAAVGLGLGLELSGGIQGFDKIIDAIWN